MCLDIVGRLAHENLGVAANRQHAPHSVDCSYCYDGGFVDNDAVARHVDERICGSQVDREIPRSWQSEETEVPDWIPE